MSHAHTCIYCLILVYSMATSSILCDSQARRSVFIARFCTGSNFQVLMIVLLEQINLRC